MTTIYLCFENSDFTEGRGPMRPMLEHGYFESEDAAWESLRDRGGIMGRKPPQGDWRGSRMGDYDVHPVDKAKMPTFYALPEVGDLILGGVVQKARRLSARYSLLLLLYGNPKPFTVTEWDMQTDMHAYCKDYQFLTDALLDFDERQIGS